jgi:hypothetical protein
MVLTSFFTWEDLLHTNVDDHTQNMTAMAVRVKKIVKGMFMCLFLFHGGYIVIRLIFSEQRVMTANSFYILDVSRSPVYELIILSQVHRCDMQKFLCKYTFFQNLVIKIIAGKNIMKILKKYF